MNRLGLTSASPLGRFLRPTAAAPTNSISSPTTQQLRAMSARKGKGGDNKGDVRVRMIRYFLFHPAKHTPRPLKFGTMRYIRHWTIHRAWQLFRRAQRKAREEELARQYDHIRLACEELARTDGRLYRVALGKKGLGTFPIELRIPTDTPSKNGWNHKWKRQ